MPGPPTMRRLHMDLSVSPVDLPMFHDSVHASLQSVPADELVLSQVFNTSSAVSAAKAYLNPWEVSPSADRYSALMFLDIKVTGSLYPLLGRALDHVSHTLAELVLHLGTCSIVWLAMTYGVCSLSGSFYCLRCTAFSRIPHGTVPSVHIYGTKHTGCSVIDRFYVVLPA